MKKKSLVWLILILFAVISGAVWYFANGQAVKAGIGSVTKGSVTRYIEETATVKCHKTRTIYTEGTGKILEIKAEAGDVVKSGDLLALLDKSGLELQLEEAQAKIDSARAQLKGTEMVNYVNRIEIAKASVEQAKLAYETALRTYNSVKQLYEENSSSKDDLDKAEDTKKSASLTLESAQSELAEVKRGASESVREGYEAALEQANVYRDMISDNIKKQEIRANFDGLILEKLVEDNSYIVPGTPAFVIGDNSLLELESDILAEDAACLKIGNAVEASGKAALGRTIKGKVAKIAPSAKTVVSALGVNQKRVMVTISLEGETDFLKPGYDLDIKVITDSKGNTLIVPDTSVFDQNGSSAVFVVENGRAVVRSIKKGIEGKDLTEVTEGLKEGEKILVKPDNGIRAGMKIKEG